jgi:PAS domain S-box-containing protein
MTATPPLHYAAVAAKILLLALAYLITGRLAMLLAIPPGFVSAIFPPVGVALAAVLIWGYPMLLGVFLGSTLLNLSLAVSSIDQLSWQHLPVAAGIALGTTLQSLCASWLIRRFVGFPNPLTGDRSIMLLLLIGGPLTCLLSASVGSAVLYFHQIVTSGQILFSWWIGDSIGVLIATPLMFILFAEPREIWRNRTGTVGLPLLLSCFVMVVVFFRTSADEQSRLQQRFHEQAKLMVQSVSARIALHAELVVPIERLFAASADVSRSDFAIFVDPMVRSYSGVRALSWNVRVPAAQRAEFEATLKSGISDNLTITERNADSQLIPAATRAEYYPVTYVEPLSFNRKAIGYDVSSEPLRHEAMLRARDSAVAALTAPLTLVQDETKKVGMLLFYPVYSTPLPPSSLQDRQQLLRGYIVAVLHIAEVIEAALAAYPANSFQLQVADISQGVALPLFSKTGVSVPAYARSLILNETFIVAGRRFSIGIQPSEQFLAAQSSLQPWAILAGGLLLCSFLGGFLLSVTGRAEHVRQLVRQRTLELSGILNNAAEAILIFDSTGKIDRANAAAQQLFGYNEKQFPGMTIGDLLPALHHINPQSMQSWLGRPIESTGTDARRNSLELEVSLSNYVLPDRTWFLCLLHDISERKKVERLKREFVATVSHELRTPLTSIKGSLELVNAGVLGPIPESAGNMLQMAQQNTARLAALVNDILDIEKLELGETSLTLAPASLRAQLELALQQNQGYADNFAVHLQLDLHLLPVDVQVMVNEQRLQQVLSNLISNAVKFSARHCQVTILAGCSGEHAFVKVCDHGPGIPAEFRSRIFQKFAQADGSDARQRGGTGLGLSICKELMTRMHGSIGFDSVEGVGSTFYITLPLADVWKGDAG